MVPGNIYFCLDIKIAEDRKKEIVWFAITHYSLFDVISLIYSKIRGSPLKWKSVWIEGH